VHIQGCTYRGARTTSHTAMQICDGCTVNGRSAAAFGGASAVQHAGKLDQTHCFSKRSATPVESAIEIPPPWAARRRPRVTAWPSVTTPHNHKKKLPSTWYLYLLTPQKQINQNRSLYLCTTSRTLGRLPWAARRRPRAAAWRRRAGRPTPTACPARLLPAPAGSTARRVQS
jgi:hypothetical protein